MTPDWLCEVQCSACDSLIFAQVGRSEILDKHWVIIKCCKAELRIIWTPIETEKNDSQGVDKGRS